MTKQLSCGFLFFNKQKQLLLCHITPTATNCFIKDKFDIPKGQMDNNESALEVALRELFEETNVDLSNEVETNTIIDLGVQPYNKKKNIHLFLFWDKEDLYLNDLTKLKCNSTFVDALDGKTYTENDGFKLFEWGNVIKQNEKIHSGASSYLYPSMAKMLSNLNLYL